MDQDQVRAIVNKQIARNILSKQTSFVTEMVQEGLLTPKDANLFYEEINEGNKIPIYILCN